AGLSGVAGPGDSVSPAPAQPVLAHTRRVAPALANADGGVAAPLTCVASLRQGSAERCGPGHGGHSRARRRALTTGAAGSRRRRALRSRAEAAPDRAVGGARSRVHRPHVLAAERGCREMACHPHLAIGRDALSRVEAAYCRTAPVTCRSRP